MFKRFFRKTKKSYYGDFPDSVIPEVTERQLAKKECKDGEAEAESRYEDSFYDDLVWEVEMLQATQCSNYEDKAASAGIAYKCTCVRPETLSEEELQELYDKLRLDKNSEFI